MQDIKTWQIPEIEAYNFEDLLFVCPKKYQNGWDMT